MTDNEIRDRLNKLYRLDAAGVDVYDEIHDLEQLLQVDQEPKEAPAGANTAAHFPVETLPR